MSPAFRLRAPVSRCISPTANLPSSVSCRQSPAFRNQQLTPVAINQSSVSARRTVKRQPTRQPTRRDIYPRCISPTTNLPSTVANIPHSATNHQPPSSFANIPYRRHGLRNGNHNGNRHNARSTPILRDQRRCAYITLAWQPRPPDATQGNETMTTTRGGQRSQIFGKSM